MTDDRDKHVPKHPRANTATPRATTAAPPDAWDGHNSDVHMVPVPSVGESQLATIERVTREVRRDVRESGGATSMILAEHDTAIKSLAERVGAVELTVADVKTLNEQQNGKLDLNNAKLDGNTKQLEGIALAVKSLDPNAPHIVRQIVQEELRVSTITESRAAAGDKRKLTQITVEGALKLLAGLISAGVIGALLQSHSC